MNYVSEHALGTATRHWHEPPWRVFPDDWPDVRPLVITTAVLLRKGPGKDSPSLCSGFSAFVHPQSPQAYRGSLA